MPWFDFLIFFEINIECRFDGRLLRSYHYYFVICIIISWSDSRWISYHKKPNRCRLHQPSHSHHQNHEQDLLKIRAHIQFIFDDLSDLFVRKFVLVFIEKSVDSLRPKKCPIFSHYGKPYQFFLLDAVQVPPTSRTNPPRWSCWNFPAMTRFRLLQLFCFKKRMASFQWNSLHVSHIVNVPAKTSPVNAMFSFSHSPSESASWPSSFLAFFILFY